MKIITVLGARPQFIKAALVSKRLRESGIKEILVHTGQHYDFNMSDVFFHELAIPKPDHYLGIGSGSHGYQTGNMLMEIEKILLKEKPDLTIVYGDTNTTLAAALSSVKLHIPIAHIEAGLRSFNKKMPEEINRVLTDHISDILFAPTDIAVENLKMEGITKGVYKVGDVMFDVALATERLINHEKILREFGLEKDGYILATIHRAENTDVLENLKNIIDALEEVANNNLKVFFPAHPRTKSAMEMNRLKIENPYVRVVEPVSYIEMISLEKNARLIVTDSGGVQKEAYFFRTPSIILRNETEWVELVEIGFNILAGTKKDSIVNSIHNRLNRADPLKWINFYGNGKASERIVEIIKTLK